MEFGAMPGTSCIALRRKLEMTPTISVSRSHLIALGSLTVLAFWVGTCHAMTPDTGAPGFEKIRAKYQLPFSANTDVFVTQSPDGPATTHNSPSVAMAIDIAMPIGTPVLAARSGTVAEVIDGFGEGRMEPEYLNRANFVRILHEDGTWAEYLHLQKTASGLKLGSKVEAGRQLGWSGNSGYSSGPHLHFVVQRNDGGRVISLPVQFWDRKHGYFRLAYHQKLTEGGQFVGSTVELAPLKIKRPLKSCMKPGNLIDAAVLKCMNG